MTRNCAISRYRGAKLLTDARTSEGRDAGETGGTNSVRCSGIVLHWVKFIAVEREKEQDHGGSKNLRRTIKKSDSLRGG